MRAKAFHFYSKCYQSLQGTGASQSVLRCARAPSNTTLCRPTCTRPDASLVHAQPSKTRLHCRTPFHVAEHHGEQRHVISGRTADYLLGRGALRPQPHVHACMGAWLKSFHLCRHSSCEHLRLLHQRSRLFPPLMPTAGPQLACLNCGPVLLHGSVSGPPAYDHQDSRLVHDHCCHHGRAGSTGLCCQVRMSLPVVCELCERAVASCAIPHRARGP